MTFRSGSVSDDPVIDWPVAFGAVDALEAGLDLRQRALVSLLAQRDKTNRAPEARGAAVERQDRSYAQVERLLGERLDDFQASVYDLDDQRVQELEPELREYRVMIRRIRETVRAVVPRTATVGVVSGGDDSLASLYGRRVLHVPATADGHHAGRQPATSDEAIAYAERARLTGASFLVVPRTEFWWLERYPAFSEYLAKEHVEIHRDEHCVISSIGLSPATEAPLRWADGQSDDQVVSVLLPVHNAVDARLGESPIRRSIESVLSQEDVAVELIIVDDGSYDGTDLVLARYDGHAVVNVLTLQKPRGLGAALNIAACASTGSFLARIDVGGIYTARLLRASLYELTRGGLDVVGWAEQELDADGAPVGTVSVPQDDAEIRRSLREEHPMIPSALVMRRGVWGAVGGYSMTPVYRFAEDYEFIVRVASSPEGFRMRNLPSALYQRTASGPVAHISADLVAAAHARVRELANAELS